MKFDDCFQYIGDIGIYQVMLYFMTGLINFLNAPQNIGVNFFAGSMDHWCQVDRLQNWSYDVQRMVAIPYEEGSGSGEDVVYQQCRMYDLDYENLTDQEIATWDRSRTENATTIECTSARWVYDQTDFVSTINSEFNLVCDRSWMSQFVSTAYMFGVFVSSAISGLFSDRFGRRPTMLVACLCHFAFGIGQAFAPNYTVYVIMRFLVPLANYCCYACSFVIMMEFLGPKYRTILATFYQAFFSFGIMVVAGMGYAIRDHNTLLLVVAMPILSTIPLVWALPESPRWLMSRGRHKEADKIIRKVAAVNGRTIPDNFSLANVDDEKEAEDTTARASLSMADVCQNSMLCRELALMCLNWFTTSLVYYGLSFNTAAFGSVFLNTFLSGLIEVPALMLCVVCMEKGSKRWSNAGCLLLAGLFCLACVPVLVFNDELSALLTTLSTIGKGAITFSFAVIYVVTAELFPTPIRHKALGTCSLFARVGSMISPYMGPPMEDVWLPLPSLLFGCVAVFTGFMVLMLPETSGHKMPDNIEEAEFIGRLRRRLRPGEVNAYSANTNGNTASDTVDNEKKAEVHQYSNKAFVNPDTEFSEGVTKRSNYKSPSNFYTPEMEYSERL